MRLLSGPIAAGDIGFESDGKPMLLFAKSTSQSKKKSAIRINSIGFFVHAEESGFRHLEAVSIPNIGSAKSATYSGDGMAAGRLGDVQEARRRAEEVVHKVEGEHRAACRELLNVIERIKDLRSEEDLIVKGPESNEAQTQPTTAAEEEQVEHIGEKNDDRIDVDNSPAKDAKNEECIKEDEFKAAWNMDAESSVADEPEAKKAKLDDVSVRPDSSEDLFASQDSVGQVSRRLRHLRIFSSL